MSNPRWIPRLLSARVDNEVCQAGREKSSNIDSQG